MGRLSGLFPIDRYAKFWTQPCAAVANDDHAGKLVEDPEQETRAYRRAWLRRGCLCDLPIRRPVLVKCHWQQFGWRPVSGKDLMIKVATIQLQNLVLAVLVVLPLAMTHLPFKQGLFGTDHLDLETWLRVVAAGVLVFTAIEIEKLFWRRRPVP